MQEPIAFIKEISARCRAAGGLVQILANPHLSFRVGVTLNIHWAEPEDPSDPTHMEVILVAGIFRENFQASETVMQFSLGWFAKPILVDGRYPEVV